MLLLNVANATKCVHSCTVLVSFVGKSFEIWSFGSNTKRVSSFNSKTLVDDSCED